MHGGQRVRRSLCVAVMCVIGVGAASAASALPIALDTWYEFSFTSAGVSARGCAPADPLGLGCDPSAGTPTTFAPAPDWTFNTAGPGATLTVVDAFISGDRFEVLDLGIPIGMTSLPAAGFFCGDDPVPCLASANMSSGVFLLAPGAHSLSIAPLASLGSGAAYFRVDSGSSVIPEPASLTLLASGLAALLLRARRSRGMR